MKHLTQRVLHGILVVVGVCEIPRPAQAIQILENTREVNGVIVADTLTIGITSAQLLLGPIQGFFVNLVLFPITGPQPEITLFEFDLLGVGAIAPDERSARWVFAQPVVSPTAATAELDINFQAVFPPGTEAIYSLSSLDGNLQPLETVQFSVPAPIPEPSMFAPLLFTTLLTALFITRYNVRCCHLYHHRYQRRNTLNAAVLAQFLRWIDVSSSRTGTT